MNNDQQYAALISVLVIFLLILGGIIFYALRPAEQSVTTLSGLVLSPTPTLPVSPTTEPVIVLWRTYSSEKYLFSIDVPQEWKEVDYAPSFRQGGTLVAFSSEPLPCDTCTYYKNGYFSVRIFNKQTNPEQYALFLQKMSQAGKQERFRPVLLDKKQGVYSENTASVEHQGWVYEITLDRYDGTSNPLDSKIFVKALTSFRFTGLQFDK